MGRSAGRGLAKKMLERTARGPVTLFLGAGVSVAQGIPSWPRLVDRVRRRVGLEPFSWLVLEERDGERIERANELISRELGPALLSRFGIYALPPHPLAFQIALEEAEEELRKRCRRDDVSRGKASRRGSTFYDRAGVQLEDRLREALYQDLKPGPAEGSLGVIAEVLRQDRLRDAPRIIRVITTNADDLLEQELNREHDFTRAPAAWPVARAGDHPRRRNGADGKPPVAIYHIHGYLPQRARRDRREAPDTLVFTDAQYWESLSSPSSFANRVAANALHDSYCLFIGLSMTDFNLMRWLGLHAGELVESKLAQARRRNWAAKTIDGSIKSALERHYWLRTADADPSNFISQHLRRRGVRAVEIPDWDEGFRRTMKRLFPTS